MVGAHAREKCSVRGLDVSGGDGKEGPVIPSKTNNYMKVSY